MGGGGCGGGAQSFRVSCFVRNENHGMVGRRRTLGAIGDSERSSQFSAESRNNKQAYFDHHRVLGLFGS